MGQIRDERDRDKHLRDRGHRVVDGELSGQRTGLKLVS